jgi:sec-independent protein translocase protein TatA
MFNLGPWEIVVILLVLVFMFGTKKLPGLGTAIGEGLNNFKKALREPLKEDDPKLVEKKETPGGNTPSA